MTIINLDRAGNPVIAAPPTPRKLVQLPSTPSARPAGVSVQEWARRRDAVREAAREFEPLADQDVRERLRGVTSKPLGAAEVGQFRVDARHQHVDDLVDVLDQAERGSKRGRRTVRVQAPRGYVTRAVRGLAPHEAVDVRSRLAARGWDDQQLRGLDARLPEPDVNAVMDPLSVEVERPEPPAAAPTTAGEDLARAVAAIQPPVVNVERVAQRPRRMVVERDDRGLISSVTVEDVDAR